MIRTGKGGTNQACALCFAARTQQDRRGCRLQARGCEACMPLSSFSPFSAKYTGKNPGGVGTPGTPYAHAVDSANRVVWCAPRPRERERK